MRKRALVLAAVILAAAGALWGSRQLSGESSGWTFERLAVPEGELDSFAARGSTVLLGMQVEGGESKSSYVLYRSQDGGKSWQRLEEPRDCWRFSFSFHFEEDGRVIAAGRGVWASSNGGLTWEKVGQLVPESAVAELDLAPDGTIWLATYPVEGHRYVYRWDGSWQQVLDDATMGRYGKFRQVVALSGQEALLVAGHKPGDVWKTELWRTEDGGRTWTISEGFPDLARPIVKHAIPLMDWGLLVGTAEEGIWESRDNGKTWEPFHSSPRGSEVSPRGTSGLLVALVYNGREPWLYELVGDGWRRLRKIDRCCVGLTVADCNTIYLTGRPDFLERGVRQR